MLEPVNEDTPIRRRAVRSDYLRAHKQLMLGAGRLLSDRGRAFSLPDLARESGVSIAAIYRHFGSVEEVFVAYYAYELGNLDQRLLAASRVGDAMAAFEDVCSVWIEGARSWGRAATHLRSAAGYLERVRAGGDAVLLGMYSALAATIERLLDEGRIEPIDVDFAVLVWTTLFDERVIVDLGETLGWGSQRMAHTLGSAVLGAWHGSRSTLQPVNQTKYAATPPTP